VLLGKTVSFSAFCMVKGNPSKYLLFADQTIKGNLLWLTGSY